MGLATLRWSLTLTLCLAAGLGAKAATLADVDALPASTAEERADYGVFLRAADHRAFAVAPGGDWGLSTGQGSLHLAESKALAACSAVTYQPCQLYAADRSVVFDQAAWQASWRTTPSDATHARFWGTAVGQRFPNIAIGAPDGSTRSIASFRGRVVLLHFWATWCGPCQRELPDIDRLYRKLVGTASIAIVPVQVLEPITAARQWALWHGVVLPLCDGGGGSTLRLANGREVPNRQIAPKYPTSYVLDANGVVVFVHAGPVERWVDYLPLLDHLAAAAAQRAIPDEPESRTKPRS